MKCFYCKGDSIVEGKATDVFEFGDNLIVIRNIPCQECDQCGERYYDTDIVKQIEKIVSEVKKVIQEVSVIDYSKVA